MLRLIITLIIGLTVVSSADAQSMFLSVSSDDYQVTNVFSDVDTFAIDIEISSPLAPGNYVNPDIVGITYSVSGTLVPGTPSGFPSFALQRDLTGVEFYAQGSSLSFEIGPNAVLSDGVQAVELIGNGIVFAFDGREIGNGRFHPALLELNADGSGRIQNSDNIVVEVPLQQVDFGAEYVTDLVFDPGNTTLITGTLPSPNPVPGGGGGGATSLSGIGTLFLLSLFAAMNRKRRAAGHQAEDQQESKGCASQKKPGVKGQTRRSEFTAQQ